MSTLVQRDLGGGNVVWYDRHRCQIFRGDDNLEIKCTGRTD